MIAEYLQNKRVKIVRATVGSLADLDLGAGRMPKGFVTLDHNPSFKPDVVADLRSLPFVSGAIGSVVCSHIIEHVEDPAKLAGEVKRILRTDGVCMFFVPNRGSILWRLLEPIWVVYYERAISREDSPKSHIHFFTMKKLEALLRRFFPVISIRRINLGMELCAICKMSRWET